MRHHRAFRWWSGKGPASCVAGLCLCAGGAATANAAAVDGVGSHLPRNLSELGVFDGSDRPPVAHAIAYEPAWPLWSNGSDKQRHIVIPPGRQIDTSDPNDWKFPVGTLFFKTFSFETREGKRPVETRVIRGLESGWEFAVYEWSADGQNAALADISSPRPVERALRDGTKTGHEIPSRLQCRQCHEANGNFILGFSELNLNAAQRGAGDPAHTQLAALQDRGLMTHPATRPAGIEEDELGGRAIRGYVQGNCVHCHNGRSQVDLSHRVFLANTLARPTRSFLFPPGMRIVPGRPDESLLYQAFARSHPLASTHMPPVGVQRPDADMIQRLSGWIAALAGRDLPPPPEDDLVSALSAPRRADPAHPATPPALPGQGYVPNRHASSPAGRHAYPLGFERIELDGDHSTTRGFTALRFLPKTDLFLLAEHEGRISLYSLDADRHARRRGVFGLPDVCVRIECGLVSMELDPDFASNSFFYVGYCHQDPAQVRVARLRLDRSDPALVSASLAPVISIDAPDGKPWHTIGSILFDADKCMWVLTGERGLGAPARDLGSLLGAALRIIPNRHPDESGYTLPAGNPRDHWYTRGRGELMAKGLRNPWTGTFDPLGRLWIADVGERYEEVNLLNPRKGFHDFGWPGQDGRCDHGCGGTISPVVAYTRGTDHRYFREDPGTYPVAQQCVYVGPYCLPDARDVYAGRLDHTLIFGDLVLGWVRGLTLDPGGRVTADRLLGNMPGITSWAWGPDGFLYVTTFAAYTQDLTAVFRVAPR